MDHVVEVIGLRKSYGANEVLHGIDIAVPRGSVVGVIGPNGAGKTTLMRCLLDIIRPSGGDISVLGTPSRDAGPEIRRRIGYLPGELILEGRTTGRRLLRHFEDISGPVKPGKVQGLAERLGLDLDRQTRRLSKGNKQKLGIIQAFMHEPELLILDEPTSGLDPLMQQEFLSLVSEAREAGQTVFLSSHVISEIQQAADTVAILREGSIATISTVAELREGAISRLRIHSPLPVEQVRGLLGRLEGLGGLRLEEKHDGDGRPVCQASATWSGPVAELVDLLPQLRVVDLALEEPDLEEVVLGLYRAPGATDGQHTAGRATS
ncbi:ABC transporter ATP-binding protein [Arthrobacter rhombi]|uniref:ABC transporter, ATP-binding protein n=1 Tax=Arthrobacter rhombi TaxID=71253 RepID=A0A1R4FRA2_9MICC|nr:MULTISPECIES: ABC transporter ATP-binding protein [Micrococcaceae]PCC24306.1 ABC transporter ATP-binding protein [Glutamicibacter sp. BW78]SJM58409.1 ABC transporter, ATP-binding protein [Arthrobacter rhombi]